jgi:phage terminase large subunit-like protein
MYEEIGPMEYDRGFRCIETSSAIMLVRRELIQYYDAELLGDPWRLICIQSYDLAITQKTESSFFAAVTLLYDPDRNYVFVADAWNAKLGFVEQAQAIVREASKWKPERILVEETGYQSALREYLFEIAREPLPIFPVKPGNKSKELRLTETVPMFEAGRIFFNPSLDPTANVDRPGLGDIVSQIVNFVTMKDKDLADAFAYGVLALRNYQKQEDDDEWENGGEGVAARMTIL